MAKKSIFGTILGAVADYYTGGLGGFTAAGAGIGGTMDKNDADDKRLQKNMEFQDYMSSSAYQRATIDMNRAGINPMVAYSQGGASSPSGGAMPASEVVTGGVSSALAAVRNRADVENLEKMGEKIDSDTLVNKVMAMKLLEDAKVSSNSARNLGVQNTLLSNQVPKSNVGAEAYRTVGEMIDQAKENLNKLGTGPEPFVLKGRSSAKDDIQYLNRRFLGR